MDGMVFTRPAAPCRPPLTEAALCAWVGQASPGDRIAYHRGFLAIDIGSESRFGTPAQRRELRRVADRAWQLAEVGAVHLAQGRNGDADYTYFLVLRPR